MLKPSEIERLSMAMDEPMRRLENEIMTDIIRRIKENGGEISRAADWQIYRLHELGMAQEDINNAIQSALNYSDEEMQEMYRNVIAEGYAYDSKLYKAAGVPRVPFEDNLPLQQLINSVGTQTASEFKNFTQSLGFAIRNPNGTISYQPIATYYQQTLDNAVMGIASGVFDYNTVINKTVAEMTNSGLRTVDYDSGWSNRIDVAARRAIMTGLSQITAKVNESNANELGTDTYEVSWHSGARPTHQVWQGKWYTHQQLIDICGLGTVTGLCGANCYHDYYPVIPGISEPTYTAEELRRMNAEENKKTEFRGKEYTKYEALQRQRKLETTMRAQRQKIRLLEEGGADEDDILAAKARYRATSHEYAELSKATGLPQQRQRVYVDGLGTIKTKNVDKSAKSGIIKETSKKPITKITDNAIEGVPKVEVSGYTDEQCTKIQEHHKELLKYARDKNDSKEVAFVFDSSLNDKKPFLGEADKLEFGSALYGKDLFVMHNHPRNSSYSTTDLIFFVENSNVKTLTIVKNNGNVEYLTKGENFDARKFKLEYDRLYRKIVKNGSDNEKDKFVKALLSKNKSGVIWSERE